MIWLDLVGSAGTKLDEFETRPRWWDIVVASGLNISVSLEIYNWFTEGFNTADLKDAKALLDE